MYSGFLFGNLSMLCPTGDNQSAGDHKAPPIKLLERNITTAADFNRLEYGNNGGN
jgi:hypothetical protein